MNHYIHRPIPMSVVLKRYSSKKLPNEDLLNRGCYLFDSFKQDDYNMLVDESKDAMLTLYNFDTSRIGIGQTKICPWCHSKKTKVGDWALHCQKSHPILDSSDRLRQVFARFKVQSYLYQILTQRLRKNWKQIAIMEGGCHQCLDTTTMFDGKPNTKPYRCVRMDTPKSRMVGFNFFGINIRKWKKKHNVGDNIVIGGILEWSATRR